MIDILIRVIMDKLMNNKNNKSVKFLWITPKATPTLALLRKWNESLKRFMECNSQTSSRDSKAKINFLERNYLIRLNCCLYETASTNFLVLLFFPSVNTNRAAENTPNSASNPFTSSPLPREMSIPHSETNNKIN